MGTASGDGKGHACWDNIGSIGFHVFQILQDAVRLSLRDKPELQYMIALRHRSRSCTFSSKLLIAIYDAHRGTRKVRLLQCLTMLRYCGAETAAQLAVRKSLRFKAITIGGYALVFCKTQSSISHPPYYVHKCQTAAHQPRDPQHRVRGHSPQPMRSGVTGALVPYG